ncbi:MAG TPA: amino acid ABC transporter permease [Tissierellaceae bacterium]
MGILNLLIDYKYYYLTGIKITIALSFFSLIIGTTLGALLSLLRLSKFKIPKAVATAYIEVIRGTPMMVQIALVYFGSYVLMGVDMNTFLAALIAVSLNSAAYVAEIIRSGIQSVDKGQWEASKSLGLTNVQTMRYIILPQAVKNILPALGNEFVTLIKETSVASTIGVLDLMHASKIVQSNSYKAFEPLVIVAAIYFILTFTLSKLVGILERRLSYHD